MAFTQDGISYIGTDSRDSLVLTTGVGTWEGGPAFIEALGDDDQVVFNGNAVEITMVAGDGADITEILPAGAGIGQLAASSINGNGGDDTTLWGNITGTSLYGGQGNDSLRTSAGLATTNASEIQGNKGDDIIALTGTTTFTTIYGGRDSDTITLSDAGGRNAFSNEIQGNKGDDEIFVDITGANSRDNAVYGGQDQDLLFAFNTSTSVLLSGDKGNDTLVGGSGDDSQTLDGGENTDILIYTGNNATTMIGGEGGDTFRFNALSDAEGAPFVEDFDTLTDNIQLNVTIFGEDGVFFNTPTSQGLPQVTGSADVLIAPRSSNGALGGSYFNFSSIVTNAGQLGNFMLFKGANFTAVANAVNVVADNELRTTLNPGFSDRNSAIALGFSENERRLYAFFVSRTTSFSSIATSNAVIAQFATNNVNGSDIFLV